MYVKRYLLLGIYLFTNRVITHFGSNFLKILHGWMDGWMVRV